MMLKAVIEAAIDEDTVCYRLGVGRVIKLHTEL